MKKYTFQKRLKAFSLLELLVAMGMFSIVSLVVGSTIGQIYLQQRRVSLRQDFHNEARLVMEQIVQIVRNNTIDYDRYFENFGPLSTSGNCETFDQDQVDGTGGSTDNTAVNKAIVGYSNVFTWDTDFDDEPDRSLGGLGTDGTTTDPCTAAWVEEDPLPAQYSEDPKNLLYLINGARTVRTHVQFDSTDAEVQTAIHLGLDTDNDQRADKWASSTRWTATNVAGERCEGEDPETPGNYIPVLGQPSDDDTGQRYCLRAHDLVSISPSVLEVLDVEFHARPQRDPYLAFRLDEEQTQPYSLIAMLVALRDPETYGYQVSNRPTTRLQTSASSRVFGDNRY